MTQFAKLNLKNFQAILLYLRYGCFDSETFLVIFHMNYYHELHGLTERN